MTRHRTPLRKQIVEPTIAAFLADKPTITDDEFARDFFGRDWDRPSRGVRTSLANILHIAGYQRATIQRGERYVDGWCLRPRPAEPPHRPRINAHRERRITVDVWDPVVAALLADRFEVLGAELFGALGVASPVRSDQMRLAGVMWRLGWFSHVRWDAGIKRSLRVWAKKAPPVEKSASPG